MSSDKNRTIKTELNWLNTQQLRLNEHQEICQCGTEKVIKRSSDPTRMRATLLSLFFIDQYIYTYHQDVYDLFRSEFTIPKLRGHSFGGTASPSWLVFPNQGYDKLADWDLIAQTLTSCAGHVKFWLSEIKDQPASDLIDNINFSIANVFDSDQQSRLLVDDKDPALYEKREVKERCVRELNEEQQSVITQKIEFFFEELVSKFLERRIGENDHTELTEIFSHFKNVTDDDIDFAMAWRSGDSSLRNRQTRKSPSSAEPVKQNWALFSKNKYSSGESVFNFWNTIDEIPFSSAVTISHLCKPTEIPLVDVFTYDAIHYFIQDVNSECISRIRPRTWNEVKLAKDFIDTFTKRMQCSNSDLDKYLMMFGRHVAPRL